MDLRTEYDMLGSGQVPAEAYYGIHTQRSLLSSCLSGAPVSRRLIKAYALVKQAACEANKELGFLNEKTAGAICSACRETADGAFEDQFLSDALQGGAGTSTNMNVNEVIANRAIEILGGRKGDYSVVNPIGHVNLHQSTNDTYPTALKVAAIGALRELSRAIAGLQGAFQEKEKEFGSVIVIGRTEMQEAVPMTLGAQFGAFAEAFSRDRWRISKCEERLRVINLGGTAVGTGLAAPKAYIFLAAEKLRALTGMGLSRAENMVDATSNNDPFAEVSGIMSAHSCNLIKAASDLRLLHMTGEITLPAVQAGSSIMPGKVNPVILEAVIQAGIKARGADVIVQDVVCRGSLQINEFLPLLAHAMLDSIDMLIKTNTVFAGFLRRVGADARRCEERANSSRMLITAFIPQLGYDKALALLKEFDAGGSNDMRAFLTDKLGEQTVCKILSASSLTALGY